jgi:MFS family permease
MGYRLVQAVLVVNLGRLGDMFGRVKIYNAGFAVFTAASILLSFDPFHGARGALWLIGWRVWQAVGGSMLMANSAAILTDAFPAEQRGFALGTNQVAAIAGQFIGLVAGGVLAAIDWRAVFWVNVPVGVFGTLWAYRMLRDNGERHRGRIDWWGNITFAVGLSAVLIAITQGIQPYQGHAMGWTNPVVIAMLSGGLLLLAAFVVIETRIAEPMFQLALFRIRAFTAGNIAGLAVSIARGGLQFMLIIWLQGIWLPLHGYDYANTPLWAGIFLLPLTGGILIAGPTSGFLSDRFGARGIATAGMVVFGVSFIGLMLLPVNFRAGEQPAEDPGQRPPAAGCAGRARTSGRRAAAGRLAVRGRARGEPGAARARRPWCAVLAVPRTPARSHRPAVLPRADFRAVPPGPVGGASGRDRAVDARRGRFDDARPPRHRPPRHRPRGTAGRPR